MIKTKSGPFPEHPFYELREIEDICTQELQALELYPSEPKPIDIDAFIKKKFGKDHDYETLHEGILGFTEFGPTGVKRIVVARALSEEGTVVAERRISTTLAHEAGHGLLHAMLFTKNHKQTELFKSGEKIKPILCRDVSGVSDPTQKKPYSWSEYQANHAMSALLLPRRLVIKAVDPYCVAVGLFAGKDLDEDCREEAIYKLSDIFNVNPIVARYRLQDIFPIAHAKQLSI